MFENGYTGSPQLADLIALFSKPQELLRRILSSGTEQQKLDRALLQFFDLLRFCKDFQRFLGALDRQPQLQKAIWSLYSYWFNTQGERLRSTADEVLGRLGSWRLQDAEFMKELNQTVEEGRVVIAVLTSKRYMLPKSYVLFEDATIESFEADTDDLTLADEESIDLDAALGGGIKKAVAEVAEESKYAFHRPMVLSHGG